MTTSSRHQQPRVDLGSEVQQSVFDLRFCLDRVQLTFDSVKNQKVTRGLGNRSCGFGGRRGGHDVDLFVPAKPQRDEREQCLSGRTTAVISDQHAVFLRQ